MCLISSAGGVYRRTARIRRRARVDHRGRAAELAVLARELVTYLRARGSPFDWVDDTLAQAAPTLGEPFGSAHNAVRAQHIVGANAWSKRRPRPHAHFASRRWSTPGTRVPTSPDPKSQPPTRQHMRGAVRRILAQRTAAPRLTGRRSVR
jgi:hypothetical protein